MFATRMGSVSGQDEEVYLRPETAQGIFINFQQRYRYLSRKNSFWYSANW